MHITETEITGAMARALREKAGLTQSEFWGPLGVQQSVGCRYEADIPMPRAVRILLVTRYVGGVQIDAATPEGVADLARLAAIQSKRSEATRAARSVRADLAKAAKSIQSAADALQSI